MKKKRLILMILILFVLCLLLSLSSSMFQLQYIKIKVDGYANENFSTQENFAKIISSVKFNYGELLLSQPKSKYIADLEQKNPNLRVKSIQAVFPNTLLVTIEERETQFYFWEESTIFALDKNFKILEIKPDGSSLDCIEIQFFSQTNTQQTYFEFFNISSFAYDIGQFLGENNLVFASISPFLSILESFPNKNYQPTKISFKKNSSDFVDMTIFFASPFGVKIELKNILNNFEKKFKKSLLALLTLYKNERIKTTYGTLKIDDNSNCFWLEN